MGQINSRMGLLLVVVIATAMLTIFPRGEEKENWPMPLETEISGRVGGEGAERIRREVEVNDVTQKTAVQRLAESLPAPRPTTAINRIEKLKRELSAGDGAAAAKIAYELSSCAVLLKLGDENESGFRPESKHRIDECELLRGAADAEIQEVLETGVSLGSLQAILTAYQFPPTHVRKEPFGEPARAWAAGLLNRLKARAEEGDLRSAFEFGRLAGQARYGFSDVPASAEFLHRVATNPRQGPEAAMARSLLIRNCGSIERRDWNDVCDPHGRDI